ncbi:MAG: right-handed parallel beta-helix repeat-containing protein [Polyangiales bacterium]
MRLLALAMAILAACGGGEDGRETEVRVLVEVDETLAAESLRVRIFDTERALAAELSADVPSGEVITVPLFPSGEGERSYHVVMELLGAGGVSLGTQRVIGAYVDGESRVLRARFASSCAETTCSGRETCRDDGGTPECVDACFDPQAPGDETLPQSNVCPLTVYVDAARGTDDPAACFGPEAPCADPSYVLDEYLAGRTGGTMNVAGGSTYSGIFLGPENSGTSQTPLVIQAWPGTGRPVFDGNGERVGIVTCCSADSASHFVLSGLEVTRGLYQGILLHGRSVQDAAVLDCVVSGTVLEEVPFGSQAAGIVVTNQASDVRVIGNVVRDNQGVGTEGEPTHGIAITGTDMTIEDNVVSDNNGYGLLMFNGDNRIARNIVTGSGLQGMRIADADNVVVEDNLICGSAEQGVDISDCQSGRFEHNTLLRNGGDGLLLADFSNDWTVAFNIFAYSGGVGLGRQVDEESEPEDFQNLFWMNAGGASPDTTPDGTVWTDIDPAFTSAECDAALSSGSGAAELIDGAPVGVRPAASE